MIGLFYEMAGRRRTIVSLFLLGSVFTIMLVVVSPSVIGYYFMRIGFQLTFLPLLANTLVNDYVKVQSRGVATGI